VDRRGADIRPLRSRDERNYLPDRLAVRNYHHSRRCGVGEGVLHEELSSHRSAWQMSFFNELSAIMRLFECNPRARTNIEMAFKIQKEPHDYQCPVQ
jgi:hypothetical protein